MIGICVVGGVIIIGIAVGIWYALTKYKAQDASSKLTQPQNNDWQLYNAPGGNPARSRKTHSRSGKNVKHLLLGTHTQKKTHSSDL